MSERALAHAPSKVVIVGHTGRMGAMLLETAKAAGLNASGVDLPLADKDLALACAGADLALICVPALHLPEVARKLTLHLDPGAILADITSVKERPLRQMEEIWPGQVVGTHPLFGPCHELDADLPVAITPGKRTSRETLEKIGAFFNALGFRVFETTADKHDQAMARIQNMNFITNLAYFAALAGQKELLPYLTPSFERRKNAAAKMLTEDGEMFAGLFEANPHSHEAVREFRKMLNLAAAGDIELLSRKAQWWWPEKKDRK